jgi:K+/H+ antiporter YhaU regulatory subunit KhtT
MGMSRKLSPDSNQSYVITSPDPDLVLEDSDTAFILGE